MMRKRLVMLVATMALVLASCGGEIVESTGPQSDALGTGIGVHGAWTVTVLNSDGSPASTTEFTNDLLPEGAVTLARSLVGAVSVGNWVLDFGGPTADDSPCEWFPIGSDLCRISTPQVVLSGDALFLSGDRRATKDGAVTQVVTRLGTCDSTVTPQDCDGALKSMTGTTFDPIPVVEGQIVQVEVEISFGTLTTP